MPREGTQARLHGTRGDGESSWACCGGAHNPPHGHSRAGNSGEHDEEGPQGCRATSGGDRNYDTESRVRALRDRSASPLAPPKKTNQKSAIDDRTATHVGYEIGQRKRKEIGQVAGAR